MAKTQKKPRSKLPSGNVRVQVYWYTDDTGKRHYKSFTASTRKGTLENTGESSTIKRNEYHRRRTGGKVHFWIGSLVSNGLSPKSVQNAYGLLSASPDMFAPELTIKVRLPQQQKPDLYCPNDDDIKKLLDHIKGTELGLSVLLAAIGPMRRGETAPLESSDIIGNIVYVRKSMVEGPHGSW